MIKNEERNGNEVWNGNRGKGLIIEWSLVRKKEKMMKVGDELKMRIWKIIDKGDEIEKIGIVGWKMINEEIGKVEKIKIGIEFEDEKKIDEKRILWGIFKERGRKNIGWEKRKIKGIIEEKVSNRKIEISIEDRRKKVRWKERKKKKKKIGIRIKDWKINREIIEKKKENEIGMKWKGKDVGRKKGIEWNWGIDKKDRILEKSKKEIIDGKKLKKDFCRIKRSRWKDRKVEIEIIVERNSKERKIEKNIENKKMEKKERNKIRINRKNIEGNERMGGIKKKKKIRKGKGGKGKKKRGKIERKSEREEKNEDWIKIEIGEIEDKVKKGRKEKWWSKKKKEKKEEDEEYEEKEKDKVKKKIENWREKKGE